MDLTPFGVFVVGKNMTETIDHEYLRSSYGKQPDVGALDDEEWAEDNQQIGFVKHKLTIPQSIFYQLTCANPLFIGGYGSGKTYIKIQCAIRDLTQFSSGNVALYDPTYDQIALNTAPRMEEELTNLNLPYKYNKNDKIIRTEDHGDIIFRSMNNPESIVGYEVFRSHADEMGVVHKNHVQDVWNKIVARNRQKVPVFGDNNQKVIDIKTGKPLLEMNRICAYGTPDDGYGFTYNMWGKDPAPGYEYVRAPTYTNIDGLPEGYVDQLRRIYPAGLVDAFIEGFWTNFTTGTVYYSFDRDTNKTDYTVAEREQLHIGMDFNVYHMAAVVGVLRRGKLYIVDEFIDLRDTPDMIREIRKRYPKNNIKIYPDASGSSASSKDANGSDHKLLRDAGFRIIVNPANPFVKDRVISVNSVFSNNKVKVNINVAKQVTENLEQQTYDVHGKPDKKSGADHSNDALGYLINKLFPVKRMQIKTAGVKML
ncbi:MAG: terminase [Bacteroidia bacterium]|nr:terminase [Bacteroidia bacterium]